MSVFVTSPFQQTLIGDYQILYQPKQFKHIELYNQYEYTCTEFLTNFVVKFCLRNKITSIVYTQQLNFKLDIYFKDEILKIQRKLPNIAILEIYPPNQLYLPKTEQLFVSYVRGLANGQRKRVSLKQIHYSALIELGLEKQSSLFESTDKENREPIRSGVKIPENEYGVQQPYIIHKHFSKYQDAVIPGNPTLFHTLLSQKLNVGVINVKDLIFRVVKSKSISSTNKENYIRQLLKWRHSAYLYYKYIAFPDNKQYGFAIGTLPSQCSCTKKCNCNPANLWRELKNNHIFVTFTNKLNRDFWFNWEKWSKTNDQTVHPIINDLLEQAGPKNQKYLNHIQRLYLLSFMKQLRVDPRDIFEWFSTFVDANDWVMYFNIYAMGYFDPRFTSKEYVFSSQYICKQSGNRYIQDTEIDTLYRKYIQSAQAHTQRKTAYRQIWTIPTSFRYML